MYKIGCCHRADLRISENARRVSRSRQSESIHVSRHQLLFSGPSRGFTADSLHIDRTYCFSGVDEILYFEAQSRVMGFSRSPCLVYHFIFPSLSLSLYFRFHFFKCFNTAYSPIFTINLLRWKYVSRTSRYFR